MRAAAPAHRRPPPQRAVPVSRRPSRPSWTPCQRSRRRGARRSTMAHCRSVRYAPGSSCSDCIEPRPGLPPRLPDRSQAVQEQAEILCLGPEPKTEYHYQKTNGLKTRKENYQWTPLVLWIPGALPEVRSRKGGVVLICS